MRRVTSSNSSSMNGTAGDGVATSSASAHASPPAERPASPGDVPFDLGALFHSVFGERVEESDRQRSARVSPRRARRSVVESVAEAERAAARELFNERLSRAASEGGGLSGWVRDVRGAPSPGFSWSWLLGDGSPDDTTGRERYNGPRKAWAPVAPATGFHRPPAANKDHYRMGRYDLVTATLHGKGYDLRADAKHENFVYRGIDAELEVDRADAGAEPTGADGQDAQLCA